MTMRPHHEIAAQIEALAQVASRVDPFGGETELDRSEAETAYTRALAMLHALEWATETGTNKPIDYIRWGIRPGSPLLAAIGGEEES